MLRSWFDSLPLFLAAILAFPPALLGQQPQSLRIAVLSGDGAIHNIRNRAVIEPVVQVLDEQNRPVPGAQVEFKCPPVGPSATFFGASRTTTVTTDEKGQARADGLSPNTKEGSYQIEVIASSGSLQTSTSITQTNAVAPTDPKPKKKIFGWRLISAIAAGIGIGVTAAILRDDESTTPARVQGIQQ